MMLHLSEIWAHRLYDISHNLGFPPACKTNAVNQWCALLQVYKAKWKGVVAVKVLQSDDPGHREEFLREAQMLERLRHPHILNYRGHFIDEESEDVCILLAMRSLNSTRLKHQSFGSQSQRMYVAPWSASNRVYQHKRDASVLGVCCR